MITAIYRRKKEEGLCQKPDTYATYTDEEFKKDDSMIYHTAKDLINFVKDDFEYMVIVTRDFLIEIIHSEKELPEYPYFKQKNNK